MKVGLVGPGPAPCTLRFEWLAKALARLGHEVIRAKGLEEARRVAAACQLVFFDEESTEFSSNEWAALSGDKQSPWVQWWFGLLPEPPPVAALQQMDLVLIHESELAAELAGQGIKARWIEQACPSEIGLTEHNEAPDWDVLVLAGRATQDLRDLKLLIDEGFAIGWCDFSPGTHAPHGVERLGRAALSEFPDLTSRTCVVMGIDPAPYVPGFLSDTELLALGAGACLVRPFREGLPAVSLFTYQTQERLLGLMNELRQSVETRRSIGELARRQVLEGHTFEKRFEQVLSILSL